MFISICQPNFFLYSQIPIFTYVFPSIYFGLLCPLIVWSEKEFSFVRNFDVSLDCRISILLLWYYSLQSESVFQMIYNALDFGWFQHLKLSLRWVQRGQKQASQRLLRAYFSLHSAVNIKLTSIKLKAYSFHQIPGKNLSL